jgi:hypothetical protein
MRNCGGLHSGRLKSVRAEATRKTVRERICWKPLWKQKIMSRTLYLLTKSSRASSGTMYTRERTPDKRDTSLLLLWWKSDRQEQRVSSSGKSRMGKSSQLRSSIITRTTRFMTKRPLRWVLSVQGGHHTSFAMVRCPIKGWQLFISARKG